MVSMLKGASYIQRRPEKRQSRGQFPCFIKIRCEENRSGDKSTFQRTDEGSCHVERGSATHPRLCPGDETPCNHHQGQDATETKALDQKLDWEFGSEEED